MSAVDLIAEFADWKLFLLAIFIYSICPQWILRVLVLVYDKDDPRRHELLGELYGVPRHARPFWVAEQFETALADGVWVRLERWWMRLRGKRRDVIVRPPPATLTLQAGIPTVEVGFGLDPHVDG